ncbi:hypothetical protein AURDEDRAFT_177364 [Auricularia subglabra TFB-10046 SS5]|uniref:SUN domain-containing protein n=1 Tax=Auricularia subglabra (strain TFB-10046 / SS5) TaxID=717982 RepID=J0D4B4_AURST|nr:hypothetical protein AURDEDRAFT_177364 [Auricularia subglabra TFB-10046 SS5]
MASPRLNSQMFAGPRRDARLQGRPRLAGCSLYILIVLLVLVLFESYHRLGPVDFGRSSPTPVRCSKVAHPVNHAEFSRGARVIDSLTTASLDIPIPDLYSSTFVDPDAKRQALTSHGPPSIPEAALGLFDDARALWFFAGAEGLLTVALTRPTLVTTVRLQGHGVARTCLPRHINVWGLVTPPDEQRIPWNLFDWPGGEFPLPLRAPFERERSYFTSSARPRWVPMGHSDHISPTGNSTDISVMSAVVTAQLPVHVVSIEFKRNWGAEYTCFSGLGLFDSLDVSGI